MIKQPAYVLHSRPYRETSAMVDLFTPDYGLVRCIARGVKKNMSQGQALQPFIQYQVFFHGDSGLKNLDKYESQGLPLALKGDALFSGFYVNEVILRALRTDAEVEAEYLYEAYESALHNLQNQQLELALTAHALPTERKQLLQNGFDDYLTKPISEEQLVHSLMKWTHYQGYGYNKPRVIPQEEPNEETNETRVINWKQSLALVGGKEDLAHKMLIGLIKELTDLTPLLISGKKDELMEPIHKLHGLCKYVGAEHLRRCVEGAELCLKTHCEQWPQYQQELLLAIEEVQQWQKENISSALLEQAPLES